MIVGLSSKISVLDTWHDPSHVSHCMQEHLSWFDVNAVYFNNVTHLSKYNMRSFHVVVTAYCNWGWIDVTTL